MPIVDTDLVYYGSLNRPKDDTALTGGGVDVDHRGVLAQLAANDTLEIVSSAAGDTTQNLTVTGRDDAGAIIQDTQQLNGTTPVAIVGTFERVTEDFMDADAVGTVTVRRASAGPTVNEIPPGERGAFIFFQGSASAASPVTRYEKGFLRNNHPTLTLNSAAAELIADPSSRIRFGIEATKDDTNTTTNRVTAPAGITFVDDNVSQPLPGGTLEAGSGIGTWIEQALVADDIAYRSTYTLQLSGTTV